jgi:hypothetical protein
MRNTQAFNVYKLGGVNAYKLSTTEDIKDLSGQIFECVQHKNHNGTRAKYSNDISALKIIHQ